MRKNLKRFAAWSIAIVSLLSACFLPSLTQIAFAENTAAGQNAINYMRQAAKVQAVVSVFDDCVGGSIYSGGNTGEGAWGSWQLYDGRMARRTKNSGPDFWNDYDYHYLFDANKYEFNTGAWLENKVQGKVDNGGIWCRNNNEHILDVFASTLGLPSWQSSVICDGDQPGLMKMMTKNGDSWIEVQGQCQMGLGNDDYIFLLRSEGDAVAYVKTLYERYKANNPGVAEYLPAWSDIHTFDDLLTYNLYMDDFLTSCSDGSIYSGPANAINADNYWEIKTVDATTGEITTTYYRKDVTKENWDKSIFGSSGSHTCTDVVSSINGRADAILNEWQRVQDEERKKAEQAAKDNCLTKAEDKYTELNNRLVQIAAALSGGVRGEERDRMLAEQTAIMETMKKIQQMINDGTYYEVRGDGAVYCAEIPGVDPGDDDDGPVYVPPDVDDPSDSDNPGASDSELAVCYSTAGVLGWIVCPVTEVLGDIVEGLYGFIEKQLNIESSTVNDDGVLEGWNQIRNMANILFAIAFIIVILAQVTGIGISNYNIKKILPRLIMVVVLVNLSFIICQLLVDVSNILGSGLKSMFEGFANKIDLGGDGSANVGSVVGAIITDLFAVAGGVGVAVALGFTISWQTWFFPVLIALIGVVVSIVFFFIVIAVRQAGIVILIVLAPAAIVCYALPNTQNIYKRWQKMFTSLLLVYPICGALMGGGIFASKILLNSGKATNTDGGFLTIVAMLVQVIPFFMIPSIVKGSMTAMGNIGAKIAGAGSRFGKWGQAQVGNSREARLGREIRQNRQNDRYQERLRKINMGRDLKTGEKNQGIVQKLRAKEKSGAALTAGEKRQLARAEYREGRARSRYESARMENARNSAGADREFMTDDSDRYKNMVARMQEDVIEAEAKERAIALQNNADIDTVSTNEGSWLETEHSEALQGVTDNPMDTQAQIRLRTAEQLLMAQKDHGFDVIDRNYQKLDARYKEARARAQVGNATDADRALETGIRNAAGHLAQNHAGEIKTYGGKSALKRYQDMAALNMAHDESMGSLLANVDGDASSLSEGALNDRSDDWFRSNIEAIENGTMSANNLEQLVKVCHRYDSNPNIEHKESVRTQIDKILNAAYRSNIGLGGAAVGSGASVGSKIMSQMSAEVLSGISNQLDTMTGYDASATDANVIKKQNEIARQIANIQYAYNNSDGKLSQDQAIEMEYILKTAQAKGFAQANANADSGVKFNVDPSGSLHIEDLVGSVLNVRGASATISPDWFKDGNTWFDRSVTVEETDPDTGAIIRKGYKRLSAEDAAYADEISRKNAQARFDREQIDEKRRKRSAHGGGGTP